MNLSYVLRANCPHVSPYFYQTSRRTKIDQRQNMYLMESYLTVTHAESEMCPNAHGSDPHEKETLKFFFPNFSRSFLNCLIRLQAPSVLSQQKFVWTEMKGGEVMKEQKKDLRTKKGRVQSSYVMTKGIQQKQKAGIGKVYSLKYTEFETCSLRQTNINVASSDVYNDGN